MDRRKTEGACFYCGESGHMANEYPKKEVKTNYVRASEDTEDEESEAESVSTEELNEDGSVLSFKTTVGTPLKTQPFKALEFTILINGKCNDPTIGSYNHYYLSPNCIPRGNQRCYGLVYLIQIAGKPRIRPRELLRNLELLY